NVFITRDHRAKILDFGLAKLTQDRPLLAEASAIATVLSSPTQPGVVLGTVGYMAPEQIRGLPVDHRADLFALRAIISHLLPRGPHYSRSCRGVAGPFPEKPRPRRWRRSSTKIRQSSASPPRHCLRPWSGSSIAVWRRIRRHDFRQPPISLSPWTASRARQPR